MLPPCRDLEPADRGAPFAPWAWDRDALLAIGRDRATAFRDAEPYPHVVIDGLLGPARAAAVARAFPGPAHPGWKARKYPEQRRLAALQRHGFADLPAELVWLLAQLNAIAFVDLLGALVGRDDLIGDPAFTGAGPLATEAGGHLALHVDFNRDSTRHLDRVVSVLYYAPTDWDPAWGGELELWDRARAACHTAIAPTPDRLVVIGYGEDHWHGHPQPLRCPADRVRAVIAAHYYAARPDAEADARAHGAIW